MMKVIKYFFIFAFLLFFIIGLCAGPLNNKIIGMADHPGLQGEILMQGNIFYNFKKGDTLKYFKTDYINYPYGEDLSFAIANSLHLFMYIPLRLFFGAVDSYNIFVLMIFLLNFLAAYLLARYIFSAGYIALCSALVFALNPYFLLKVNMGFAQKYTLFLIPLYFLYLLKLRDKKKWVYLVICGFILCLIQFFYPPYAYYTVVSTVTMLSYVFFKRDELFFAVTRLIVLLVFFMAGTFLIYYSLGLKDSYFNIWHENFKISTNGCLNLFKPFHFFPYHSEGYPTRLPLGISVFISLLAIIAILKRKGMPRLIFLSGLFFIVLSAGPYLTCEGRILQFSGHKIELPFYFIAKYLPLAGGISFPIRLFPFIYLSFSILTGYALCYIRPYLRKIKPLVITVIFSSIYLSETLFLFSPLFPVRISEVRIPQAYKNIMNEKTKAVLNLPVQSDRKVINLYGYYNTLSGTRMMNSYHDNKLSIRIPENEDSVDSKKSFLESLADWDVGYIVLHQDFLPEEKDKRKDNNYSWLEYFCKTTVFAEDNIVTYKIPADKRQLRHKIIKIPGDFQSIQDGIDASKDGDTIVIAPGKYEENINFRGKAIRLKSIRGPELTVIDGGKKGSVMVFNSGEDRASIVEGFTICNGSGTFLPVDDANKSLKLNGGGVFCFNASPSIINNIIRNNSAENGGGICCVKNSSPLIKDNIIKYNKAVKGGGIRSSIYSSPHIENNKILENRASKLGGGLYWRVGSYPFVNGNEIMHNYAGEKGGGIFGSSYVDAAGSKDVVIKNCIIRYNASPLGPSMAFGGSPSNVRVEDCDIEEGEDLISDPEKILILD